MGYIVLFVAATFLRSLHATFAQVQTMTIFEPTSFAPVSGVSLAGEVIGIGTGGTTLLVSDLPVPSSALSTIGSFLVGGEKLVTETLVQDATHISADIVESISPDGTVLFDLQCGLSFGSGPQGGSCTLIGENEQNGSSSFNTMTLSGTLFALPVPLSTELGVSASATSGSSLTSAGPTQAASASVRVTIGRTVLSCTSAFFSTAAVMMSLLM